jgi:hypothetical protein
MEGRARRGRLTAKGMGSYKLGCSLRIAHEIELLKKQAPQSGGEGLIHIGNAIARRHMETHYPNATTSRVSLRPRSRSAFDYGWHDGGSVSPGGVHKQLGDGRGTDGRETDMSGV